MRGAFSGKLPHALLALRLRFGMPSDFLFGLNTLCVPADRFLTEVDGGLPQLFDAGFERRLLGGARRGAVKRSAQRIFKPRGFQAQRRHGFAMFLRARFELRRVRERLSGLTSQGFEASIELRRLLAVESDAVFGA